MMYLATPTFTLLTPTSTIGSSRISSIPVLDDKQHEPLFWISKHLTQNLLNVCAIADRCFTWQHVIES